MVWEYTCSLFVFYSSPPMYSQVERFGKPTWRRLVEAVKDDMGGSNPALAQAIAKHHQVCNHIHYQVLGYLV